MNDKAYYEPIGNNTEVALLKFLQNADIPIQDLIKNKIGFVEANVPFSTIRKNSAIAIRYPDYDMIRIFVKGAPEQIVINSNSTYDESGEVISIDDEQQNAILTNIVDNEFASKALRCMAFAYRDYSIEEFEQLRTDNNNFATDSDRNDIFFRGLRLITIFALSDQLRPEVLTAVKYAKAGKIDVRLISGDHLTTAIEFAIQARIITREESKNPNVCMTGE